MRLHRKVTVAAAAAALLGGLALAEPAQATGDAAPQITAHPLSAQAAADTSVTSHVSTASLPYNGKPFYHQGSARSSGSCKIWMNGAYRSDGLYAQGLIESWGNQCEMWLERKSGNGHWKVVSGDHWVQPWDRPVKDTTGWYHDGSKYWVHVCMYNVDTGKSFCSKAF